MSEVRAVTDRERTRATASRVAAAVAQAIRGGVPFARAGAVYGLTRRAWDRWVREAIAGDEVYQECVEAVATADAETECVLHQVIYAAAAAGDWKAADRLLAIRRESAMGNGAPAQMVTDARDGEDVDEDGEPATGPVRHTAVVVAPRSPRVLM